MIFIMVFIETFIHICNHHVLARHLAFLQDEFKAVLLTLNTQQCII
jgi:hypothetical protein